MCFTTTKIDGSAIIAEQDITAFKLLGVLSSNGELYSPYKTRTKWTPGKTKKLGSTFEQKAPYNGNSINRGFHCYRTLKYANMRNGFGTKVFLVTIPKGSLVHINDNEYCSNAMHLEDTNPIVLRKAKKK